MTTNPDGAPERVYLPLEVANAMSADAPPDKGDILYQRADLLTTGDVQCPLPGEWRHNNGFISNGTLRVLRADFDTNPANEFVDEVVNWIVSKLNTRPTGDAGCEWEWQKTNPEIDWLTTCGQQLDGIGTSTVKQFKFCPFCRNEIRKGKASK